MTDGTLSGNVRIASDGIELRDGTSVLARLKAGLLELAANSVNAIIKLCGGKGIIAYYAGTNQLAIMSPGSIAMTACQTLPDGTVQPYDTGVACNQYGVVVKGPAEVAGTLTKNSETVYAGKILYSNESGTTGTVTLSETAANFALLEIYFKTNDGNFGCAKVWAPNGKTVDLVGVTYNSSASMYTKRRPVLVSGTSISNNGYTGEGRVNSNNSCTTATSAVVILICYVLGWK